MVSERRARLASGRPPASAFPAGAAPQRIVGRYALFEEIAAGGMATVHLGRMIGPAGFTRVVAMKRMHPQFAKDPQFVAMFLDEARLAARVRHPNVVASTDVVAEDGELFIVMEYVEGESLSKLARLARERGTRLPASVSAAIMVQALHGLHAAHEAKSEAGAPLELVHRDVSPQNILVGADGMARVVDFGIARAAGRAQHTRSGVVKGKAAYMAPEQIRSEPLDRRLDVYAASVVLWELLSGERLFQPDEPHRVFEQILQEGAKTAPSTFNPEVPAALDAIVLRGAARSRDARFATALELADAIEHAVPLASQRAVSKWVESLASADLEQRAKLVSVSESSDSVPSIPVIEPTSAALAAATAAAEPPARPAAADSSAPPIEDTRSVPNRVLSVPPAPPPPPSLPLPPSPAPAAAPLASASPPRLETITGRSSDRALLAIAAAAAAAVLIAAFVIIGAVRSPAPPPREPIAWSPEVAPRTTSDSNSGEASASAHVASAAVTTKPVATAVAAESASASSTASQRPVRPTSQRCNPPFYYERGFKKFKPGCL